MHIRSNCCIAVSAILVVFSSCTHQAGHGENKAEENPLFTESTLALQAPDFSKIKDSHYQPAMEEGMKRQLAEIEKIANNPEAPTFANTLVAIEKSGELLSRANHVLNLVSGANSNPVLEKINEVEAPKLAANQDAIYLNSKLYKRVLAVYAARKSLKLDPESAYLLEHYKQEFELAGAALQDSAKTRLKKLNQEEAGLSAKFNNQLLAAAKAGSLVLDQKDALKGLSDGEMKAASESAKAAKKEGKWLLSLRNTTQQPALSSLENRDIRQKLFNASWTRAEKSDSNDTRAIIIKIAIIRAQKAKLLGFKNYVDWKLRDQMAQRPEVVAGFLAKIVPAATSRAREEAADIQKLIDQQKGGFKVQAYDWNYYSEKVRKAKFDLDDNDTKPYFELNRVLQDGVFYAANLVYGLTFKERKDLPVYQSDVRVFDVLDQDGSVLGLFYCDYFKRDNKQGGAWMSNLVEQSKLLGTKPVIYNVCNFTKPAPGEPALISFNDVTTMFHEFGHGLHGLFGNTQYPSLSGSNTARDFVEFPSQFNEHFALDLKVFAHYALHYKTKAAMPGVLVEKIKKAGKFDQGYSTTEALAATALDLQWHLISADARITDADQFEADALKKTGLDLAQVPPRYRSSYFLHIWGNGYAAGYYAYTWTKMLADDAAAWFDENGGSSRKNGQRFRDMILSRGSTLPYDQMFRAFRGHDPSIRPMLLNKGLLAK